MGKWTCRGLSRLLRDRTKQKLGIVVLGTTGEASSLDSAERKFVVETAVKYSNAPVIVGTGTNSTRTTIQYTCEAEALGANAALIVTPYYTRPTQEGLFQHYKAVHEASNLPIMLYNNPSRCGLNVSSEMIMRLASLERVVALKESSGSLHELTNTIALAAEYQPDFTLLSGDDCMAFPSIALGAKGLVSVLSNIYPKEIQEYVNLCLAGDMASARIEHYCWQPVIKELFAETNPVSVKAMMRAMGLPAGKCRLPLC